MGQCSDVVLCGCVVLFGNVSLNLDKAALAPEAGGCSPSCRRRQQAPGHQAIIRAPNIGLPVRQPLSKEPLSSKPGSPLINQKNPMNFHQAPPTTPHTHKLTTLISAP